LPYSHISTDPKVAPMQENRWSSDTTVTRPRYGTGSALLEPAEPTSRGSTRRFAPYTGTETDRDALASMALAALQSAAQAPSVLDVDAASLRLPDADERPEAQPEPPWTPPVLIVTEEDEADLDVELVDDDSGELLPRRVSATTSRRLWFGGAVAFVLVALLGGGLWTMMREPEDAAVATDAQVTAASVADPALLPDTGLAGSADQSAEVPIANVEGKLSLTEATLHDELAGDAAPAATSFRVGAQVSLWLDLAYASQGESDVVGTVWFRDGSEIGRHEQPLVDGPLQHRQPAPALDVPGAHRVDITFNEEVIASVEFEVTP
jgi:hypothetical protein